MLNNILTCKRRAEPGLQDKITNLEIRDKQAQADIAELYKLVNDINAKLTTVLPDIVKLEVERLIERKAMNEILTAQQLADRLEVTTPTIYRWANEGIIPSIRTGRQIKFYSEKVIKALEGYQGCENDEERKRLRALTRKAEEWK